MFLEEECQADLHQSFAAAILGLIFGRQQSFLFGFQLCLLLASQLGFGGITAHTEHHADVGTVDKGGGSAATDKGQRLAGNGEQAYGYHHVDQGLGHEEQGQAHNEKGRKIALAPAGDAPGPEEERQIEQQHKGRTYEPQLLYDDGKDKVGECLAEEVALHRIAGGLAYTSTGSDGNTGVGYLGILVDVVLGRTDVLVAVAVGVNAVLPRREAVEAGKLVHLMVVIVGERLYHKQGGEGKKDHHAEELQEQIGGHTADNHHQKDYAAKEGCRGEVLHHNQEAHETRDPHDVLERYTLGAFLTLQDGEHKGYGGNHSTLGYLGGLKRKAKEADPARRTIDTTAKAQSKTQKQNGGGQEEEGDDLKLTTGNIVDSQHHERTNAQEQGLLEEGLPEATALVGQRTGGAEHLHQGDDTEEEKYYPNSFVALEDTADF